jgi:hypothetical protein
VQGFRSVGPCNAGVPIVGAGTSSDPTCASGALALLSVEQTWTATQNFAAITATGATFSTGADLPITVGEWSAGHFNALSFNGLLTAGMSGLLGGPTGDGNLYYMVPTGFTHHLRVNNVDVATLDAAKFSVLATTPASSTSTGSIINAGGFGNAGAGYFGGDLVSGGNLQVSGAGTFGANVSISSSGSYQFGGSAFASVAGNYVVVQGLNSGAASLWLGNSVDPELYLRGGVRVQDLGGTTQYATIGDGSTFTSTHVQVATFTGPTTSGTNFIEVFSQFGSGRFGTYTNYPAILDGSSNPVLYYNVNSSTLTIPVLTSITKAVSISGAPGTLLSVSTTSVGLGSIVISTMSGGGNFGGQLSFSDSGTGGVQTDISSIANGGIWFRVAGVPIAQFGSTLSTLSSNLTWVPSSSSAPAVNGQLTTTVPNNTTLTFKYKGSDGIVRSVSLTMS